MSQKIFWFISLLIFARKGAQSTSLPLHPCAHVPKMASLSANQHNVYILADIKICPQLTESTKCVPKIILCLFGSPLWQNLDVSILYFLQSTCSCNMHSDWLQSWVVVAITVRPRPSGLRGGESYFQNIHTCINMTTSESVTKQLTATQCIEKKCICILV